MTTDREISPQQVQAWLAENREMTILDVRNAEDYAAEPDLVPTAERMDYERVGEWCGQFSKERLSVVYCQHGQRISNLVLEELLAAGCEARLLTGGMDGWRAGGGATVPPSAR